MDRGGMSNSGEMTTVRLDRSSYSVDEDITGTVELSNTQRKEITSVTLEFSTWRHISSSKSSKKSAVEQLSRQVLELFPNTSEARRYGHDDKILQTNCMFTFTFSGDVKRQPTIDFLEHARIKNYITCYVYKKSGLLSRERLLEKNQFQVLLRHATIDVDAMFPDRFFNCLVSRPLSSNNAYYELRARCNTHLMPGLPFLVELDMAVDAEISTITLSLHQVITTAIGAEEEDQGLVSRYVHEVQRPAHVQEGHFRDRDSARRLAQGRRSWLVEWICPSQQSPIKLPFGSTFYCKTREGNVERGLSLKVEIELSNAPVKLLAMMHNLQYCPAWRDSRPDQSISLCRERSLYGMDNLTMNSSPRSESRFGEPLAGDRRGSVISVRSQHPYYNQALGMRSSPLVSPHMSIKSSDYFGESGLARQRTAPGVIDAKLSYGSYNPQAINLLSRADSVRSVSSNQMARQQISTTPQTSRNTSGKARPEHITLPPASIRSSMSSAFESLNLRHSATNSLSSPTRKDFDEVNLSVHGMPTPPPTQPLPPAPMVGQQESSPMIYNPASGLIASSSTSLNEDGVIKARQKKISKQARPAMILGVSQDTIQVNEEADRVKEEQRQRHMEEFVPTPLRSAYTANINRAGSSKQAESVSMYGANDRDSGYSEVSYVPGSPMNSKPQSFSVPVNSSGYARRMVPEQATPQGLTAVEQSGEVMLG